MATLYVGIGSNIDPEDNLKAAATILREKDPATRFSSVYKSAPLHNAEQDDFLNAVAMFRTDRPPQAILEGLRDIERLLGKNPPFRFGPRTIDLDLLLHDSDVVESGQLILPHPRMHERRFVLEPLTELIDSLGKHPIIGKSWKDLLEDTKDQRIMKVPIRL
jgi:2-amino-4-hydroxy-6-hydroxymethyldihydropteridine diphosphokinase